MTLRSRALATAISSAAIAAMVAMPAQAHSDTGTSTFSRADYGTLEKAYNACHSYKGAILFNLHGTGHQTAVLVNCYWANGKYNLSIKYWH